MKKSIIVTTKDNEKLEFQDITDYTIEDTYVSFTYKDCIHITLYFENIFSIDIIFLNNISA